MAFNLENQIKVEALPIESDQRNTEEKNAPVSTFYLIRGLYNSM